jgi:hypothetical protein
MKKDSCCIEGPAGYNGGNPPGEALKMPTKIYPGSHDLQKTGKKTDIEGPCKEKEGYHK